MKSKTALIIHGGATSDDVEFIKANEQAYKQILLHAAEVGSSILKHGGTAVDAVKNAIVILEDSPLFNCGKGSALNAEKQVEMDAILIDGNGIKAGAVTLLKNIKNPIKVAAAVSATKCLLLGGTGAYEFARQAGIEGADDDYFFTDRQLEAYNRSKRNNDIEPLLEQIHGTVGAVALDKFGNLAAGGSTGGTCFKQPGRIGDTPLIGAGAYADNKCCAAVATGDGEIIMRRLLTYTFSVLMPSQTLSVQEACDYIIHSKCKGVKGDVGIVAIDPKGNTGIAFKARAMPRAWCSNGSKIETAIY